jgi:hypothetical protein
MQALNNQLKVLNWSDFKDLESSSFLEQSPKNVALFSTQVISSQTQLTQSAVD